MKVGLFFIATGKYQRFVPDAVERAKQFFRPVEDVDIFVLDTCIECALPECEVVLPFAMPWPLPTLLRYHMILATLTEYDYIYYMDVDMRIERPIGDEILGDLVAVQHPGYVGKWSNDLPFERRSHSRCGTSTGSTYYAGGFQGGSREHYGAAMTWMRDAINTDLSNHIIPAWHDESAWNAYLAAHPPTVVLSPDYCSRPFERHDTRKIVALDKDHAEMRS